MTERYYFISAICNMASAMVGVCGILGWGRKIHWLRYD